MRIGIIGGAGRMGRWLANYFAEHNHDITIADVNIEKAKYAAVESGASIATNNIECVKMTDVNIISVPIQNMSSVFCEILPYLRDNSIIIEISSLKSHIINVLRDISKNGPTTISIHPLFGPGLKTLDHQRIALVPVLDFKKEKSRINMLFPEAEVIVVNADIHDQAMAVTLSLPHLINIIFASILVGEDIDLLRKLGGTSFGFQLTLCESIMSEQASLYASIQMKNKHVIDHLEDLVSMTKTLSTWIKEEDYESFQKFYEDTKASLSRNKGFHKAYGKMYRILEALSNLDVQINL